MRMQEINQRIEGLLEIPANEQCIGHFQVAVCALLKDLSDEIELLQTVVGIWAG